jgi:uncharacterized membrane protein YkvI
MLAGASAALQAIFNFPYWLAGGMTLLLIAFVLRRQLNGLYLVNNLVVPILIGCMIVLCFLTGERNIQLFKPIAVAFPTVRAVFYAFAYVALNLTLAKPILLAVGATNDRRALTHGAWLAGIGIGILLFCSDYLLQHAIVRPDQLQIPIAAHAMTVSNKLGYVYYWLIYFEIVTTLLANLYSVHIQLTETQRIPTKALIPALLLLCLLLGQFGFAHLLHLIYPIIGVLGLVWLITFAVRT